MNRYSNCHIYFLQAMMQKGVVDEKECTQLIKKSLDINNISHETLNISAFIACINVKIQPFHLEIRKGNSEDDGHDVYALISITDHDINHLAIGGIFSKNEIEIFHRTVNLIVSSQTGMVSSTEILNLTEDMPQKNMLKSEVEILIAKLIKQKWVGEKDGYIYLTTRSVLELEPYIKSMSDDVVYCSICKSIVLRGINCKNCSCRIHRYCAATYFRGKSPTDRKCLTCYKTMPDVGYSYVPGSNLNESMEELTVTPVIERRKRRR